MIKYVIVSVFISSVIPCMMVHGGMQHRAMHFVTVSDSEHFPWLECLIASIVKHNGTKVKAIAVFDLGLTAAEREQLTNMSLVKIYDIQDVNPDMRKKFVVRKNGRLARGWYSWKPVVLYQALQLFTHFLYIDAGIEVCKPLDAIFHEIRQQGYYFLDSGHAIEPVITRRVRALFSLESETNQWILQEDCITAGIQGISRSLLDSYIIPMYELAFDIKNFQDDGTALWGYGMARHDQSLFSIFVRKLQYKTYPGSCAFNRCMQDHKLTCGALFHYFFLKKHVDTDPTRREHARIHQLLD